ELVVRQLLAVSMFVVEADESFLAHAGVHGVTDLLAVDMGEYLVLDSTLTVHTHQLIANPCFSRLASPSGENLVPRLCSHSAVLSGFSVANRVSHGRIMVSPFFRG